jgi:hypothetical protein
MKIIISIIVILIIIISIIIIFNSNIYFSEDFTSQKQSSFDQNNIEDLIPISYLPDNPYEKVKLNEYDVIDIYKKILIRSPTDEELKSKVYLSKEELNEDLYNSIEYDKISKVQTNSSDSNIESSIAKRNLSAKIYEIYLKTYNKDVPFKMDAILRDCYIHLRSNYYLFMAFIESPKYPKFENEILTSISMTKQKLLELFNEHFNLLELKLKAEDKIKALKGASGIKEKSIDKIKDELNKITLNVQIPGTPKSIINDIDINKLKNYLKTDIKPLELKETYANKEDDNVKILKDMIKVRGQEKLNDETVDITQGLPKDSEIYARIYNPINYKQSYRGPAEYKPPLCNSLGQPSLEVPVFPESKLLFQGTELDRAFKDTQVGSIMPKFEYKEYQEVRIK